MNRTFSIGELEASTGVNRRTIHYYTMEKLLPPPVGAGLAAKYTEEHFLRLLLIGEMQRSHLRLSGIKEALNAMTIEEMRSLAEKARTGRSVWSPQAVEQWLDLEAPQALMRARTETSRSSPSARDYSLLAAPSPTEKMSPGRQSSKNLLMSLRRKPALDNSSWQRFEVIDGLEVNVRSDVADKYGPVLLALLEEFKKRA